MGKRVQAPPTPDYAAFANQQGVENLQTAQVSARLNNPNIISPYGTQTTQWGVGRQWVPEQAGTAGTPGTAAQYEDVAPTPYASWNMQPFMGGTMYQDPQTQQWIPENVAKGGAWLPEQVAVMSDFFNQTGQQDPRFRNINGQWQLAQGQSLDPYTAQSIRREISPGTPGTAATPGTPGYWADVAGGGDPNQATVWQTLTPEGTETVRQQQLAELQMAQLGNQQAGQLGGLLNRPIPGGGVPFSFLGNTQGLASPADPYGYMQSWGANYGDVRGAPNLAGYGSASGVGPGPGAVYNQSGLPQLQKGINTPGGLQTGLNESQVAQAPINAGTTAQQAIMERLMPQQARQRTSLETQLINQGLRPGAEAYNNAMTLLGQQENDQRTQATLQGLGLDMSANQQGFGQALQRGQFGNQAQQQDFLQRVQAGEFGNQAQLAAFGAGLMNTNQINQANAQNFSQGLQSQESHNAALLARQQAAMAEQQAANQAQAQGFGNAQTMQQAQNQAMQQNYQNQLAAQNFWNTTQQQEFNQMLQGSQFANAANQQSLAQQLQLRELPINELAALMSGSQIQTPQFQSYQGGQQIQPAPIFQAGQAQAGWDQNLYNQQVAQRNATMGGLFGLGGAGLGALGSWLGRY